MKTLAKFLFISFFGIWLLLSFFGGYVLEIKSNFLENTIFVYPFFLGICFILWIILRIARMILRAIGFIGGKVGEGVGMTIGGLGALAANEFTEGRHNIDMLKYAEKGGNIGKKVGSVAGLVGSAILAGELGDADGTKLDLEGDELGNFDTDIEAFENNAIDIDDDGTIDGYDHNKDGTLDHNIDNVPITGLEDVEGHYKKDGTYVEKYQRTKADGTTINNLNPKK